MSTPTSHTDSVLVQRLQALGEETRFAIVRHLTQGERCVCELQELLEAAQPRLSFHLRKLRDAGLVTQRKDGRWSYYALVPSALAEVRSLISDLGEENGWTTPAPTRACCD